MDGWTQTLSAGWLLGIAAMAIVLILLLIVKLRVHALLTLVSVSLLTAVATGLPMDKIVNDVLLKNFGGTLSSVALLVGLGAMLGRLVETSGGAQSLADAMIRTLGNRTKKIYLGHLSKENNIKELAHMTMVNQLAQADLGVGVDFQVYDTSPDTATPLTDI